VLGGRVSGPFPLEAELELAVRAARGAGEAVMRAFRGEQEVSFKSADQPVTGADLAADRHLRGVLSGERPGYGWLSEETADSPARLRRERVWVVDPIDGTNSFVEGRPEFAVCVGLVHAGRAVLGVVHNPATGELFHAIRGGGAYRDGVRIRVSARGPGDAPRMVGSRWEIGRGELAAFREWRLEPLGSTAYRMCRIAEGRAEGFVSRGPKAEWDVCAPMVVVEEVGGRVTCLDGSVPVYNRPDPSWTGVAASNGALHEELLRLGAAGA
jgi:myo-inositol-1(or 4)-monophosphatase